MSTEPLPLKINVPSAPTNEDCLLVGEVLKVLSDQFRTYADPAYYEPEAMKSMMFAEVEVDLHPDIEEYGYLVEDPSDRLVALITYMDYVSFTHGVVVSPDGSYSLTDA
jgi:hypothetical protein